MPRKARKPRLAANNTPDPRTLINEVDDLNEGEEGYAAPASLSRAALAKDTSPEHIARLLAELQEAKDALADERIRRTEAEASALAAAEAQGSLMQRQIQEVPTGKFATVKRLDKYEVKGHTDSGQDILRPVFKSVKLPTYFYKIDLPPSGGSDLKINGVPLYHGGVYEFDIDTLRTVKEICYRCWKHDSDIHGDGGEAAYRKQQRPTLSMRAY